MPRPTLTFDLLTLKSVWESHVTWGTPVQSFVFLGLLVFELDATSDRQTDKQTDRQTDDDADHRLMPPPLPLTGRGHNNGAFANYVNYANCAVRLSVASAYLSAIG